MKSFKIMISVLLCMIMILSSAVLAFADDELLLKQSEAIETMDVSSVHTDSKEFESNYVLESDLSPAERFALPQKKLGFSMNRLLFGGDVNTPKTSSVFKIVKVFRTIRLILTGKFLTGDDGTFDVQLQDELVDFCTYISENSSLDPQIILTNLPDFSSGINTAIKVFNIDTVAVRKNLREAMEQAKADGNKTKAALLDLASAYFSGIQKAYIYLEPTDEANVYKIKCQITFADGGTDSYNTDMLVNLETGEFFGYDEKGAAGIGFNCNIYDLMVYAPMYCWMRDYGFCVWYDLFCYTSPLYRYSTRRFHFDYAGKEWMIQCWKGNYLITNGGEVGLYNREPGSKGTYYNVVTDEERLPMSLRISHGDETLVNIPETLHWWVNGFKIAHRSYAPQNLTMNFTVQMVDEEMVKAFCEAIDKNIYHDVTYTVDGLTVSVCWAAE